MAPTKSTDNKSSFTSAGAGKKKAGQSNSCDSTLTGSIKKSSKSTSFFTSKPTISRSIIPQSNGNKSGPMQTHLANWRSTKDYSPPPSPTITKSSLRKRPSSDSAVSEPAPAASSDNEVDQSPEAKLAAFHQARGPFEDLYVLSDEDKLAQDNSAKELSAIVHEPSPKLFTPQKATVFNREQAAKKVAKKAADKAAADKAAADTDAMAAKPTSRKRKQSSDAASADDFKSDVLTLSGAASTDAMATKPTSRKRKQSSDAASAIDFTSDVLTLSGAASADDFKSDVLTLSGADPKKPTATSDGSASASSSPPTKRKLRLIPPPAPPAPTKRAADSDDNNTTPSKRLKADSDDSRPTPVKRLKLHGPRTPVQTPTAPTTRSKKTQGKTKATPVITKNGKVKKTPEYAVEHAFSGTPSNHGTSLERPDFGSLATPWSCANLSCSTGMTWVPRDTKDPNTGKGPMGRKVISQFFGRNKGPTKLIPNDVWHFYCRKDYQRARYAAEHGPTAELAQQVIDNLRDQLIRLKLWRPDALFQVQLDKGATDRLNTYFALLRQHGNDEAAALAALPAPKDANKVKPEEAFPPALAEAFNQRFKTAGKDATANYDDIEAVIAWSEAEINRGNSTVFVPAEFLINPIQAGEIVNDVSNNFADWEAGRAARIAAKAAAQANSASSPSASSGSRVFAPLNIPNSTPEELEAINHAYNGLSREAIDQLFSEARHSTPTPAPKARLTPGPFRTSSTDQMAALRHAHDMADQYESEAPSDASS